MPYLGKEPQQILFIPNNYIEGLILSNNVGDSDNDIDISTGECVDNDNDELIELTITFTKQIDIGWSAGNGTGGYGSGSALADDTWYHVFIIKHADGTVDAGFDADINATSLLAASTYTFYRRIGSIRRETGANKLFLAHSGRIFWEVWSTSTNPPTGNLTLLTPPDIRCIAHIVQEIQTPNSTTYGGFVTIRPNVGSSTERTGGGYQGIGTASQDDGRFVTPMDVLTDTNSRVHNIDDSTNNSFIRVSGYTDFRGKQ